ncbi:membrane-spanning 4-domains subfamily A member 6D-like [Rhynchocyon petersi]
MVSDLELSTLLPLTSEQRFHGGDRNTPPPLSREAFEGLKETLDSTLQVMAGMLILSLGLTLGCATTSYHFSPIVSTLMMSLYPFVGAKCFVITGSLSIISDKKSNSCLVWSNRVVSVLSLLAAILGFIVLIFNLTSVAPAKKQCMKNTSHTNESFYFSRPEAINCLLVSSILQGMLSVMLLFTGLELGLAVSSLVLWWRQTPCEPGSAHFLQEHNALVSTKTPEELSWLFTTVTDPGQQGACGDRWHTAHKALPGEGSPTCPH